MIALKKLAFLAAGLVLLWLFVVAVRLAEHAAGVLRGLL